MALNALVTWAFLLTAMVAHATFQTNAAVEGRVVNSITHEGISGVSVKLTASGAENAGYSTTTDASGAFRFTKLGPGQYTVGFEAHSFALPRPTHPALQPFTIGPQTDSIRLDLELTPLAKLGGRVTDGEGRPVSRIQMELFRARRGYGPRVTTDVSGRFLFQTIEPGAYVLLARPVLKGSIAGGKPELVSELSSPEQGGERIIWAPTYFPGAAERSSAERILIRAGAELAGYDIRLRSTPVYSVRGTVLDDNGGPASRATIKLTASDEWELPDAQVMSGPDGVFTFPSVRPGDWRFIAEMKRSGTVLKGFGSTFVASHDVDDIEIRLSAPFTLDGFVERDEPRDSEGKRKVTGVYLSPVDGPRDQSALAFHEQDGTLHIRGVYPGRYEVTPVGFIPGYYLDSVLLGERGATAEAVDLTQDSPPVRVIYRANAGRVRGNVEKGEGATVVLVPRDEHFLDGQFIRSSRCERGGRFELGSLRPGEYYAFAFDRVLDSADHDALEDPVFLRGLVVHAKTVRVEHRNLSAVELRLIPWPE